MIHIIITIIINKKYIVMFNNISYNLIVNIFVIR